jgi:hypothetical protein
MQDLHPTTSVVPGESADAEVRSESVNWDRHLGIESKDPHPANVARTSLRPQALDASAGPAVGEASRARIGTLARTVMCVLSAPLTTGGGRSESATGPSSLVGTSKRVP